MVLEKLVPIDKVESNFLYGIAFGALLSLIAIIIGANIFKSDPSMAALFFIVIGAVPFFRKMLFLEEAEVEKESATRLFGSYRKIILVFLSFYIGVALTYFILSILPPIPFIGHPQALFEKQLSVFTGFSGNFINTEGFKLVFLNNFKVILLALMLSLLYGSGAVLLLSWNASTLGVFFASLGSKSLAFIPHASLEFLGFFSAAVAGGLISAGIEKHEFGTAGFRKVMRDVALLTVIAVILIFFGALVESTLF